MMYEIANPALLPDLADCFGSGPRVYWQVLSAQLTAGESRAIRLDNGRAVAVVGLVVQGQEGEAWLCLAPDAHQHILKIVRAFRLTLQEVNYSPIYTFVLTPAGARIAALLGFEFDEKVNDLELWTWVT